MKAFFLIIAATLIITSVKSQSVTADKDMKILTPANASLSLSVSSGAKYTFSYQNQMSRRADLRSIVFKSKKDAKSFIDKITKALKSKDGYADFMNYQNYQIRLLSGIGGVFMIVNETGQPQSTLRITNWNGSQLGVL